jgi:hypothetical protein
MTIYIVFSDSIEFTESNNMYLNPCVQAVFTDATQAQDYVDELANRMNSGSYSHEEYPYIEKHEVREEIQMNNHSVQPMD